MRVNEDEKVILLKLNEKILEKIDEINRPSGGSRVGWVRQLVLKALDLDVEGNPYQWPQAPSS